MTAKPDVRPQVPVGLSPQEEADWWDRHQEYWDTVDGREELHEATAVRRTRALTVRLPAAVLDALAGEAHRQAVTVESLVCQWIEERLGQPLTTVRRVPSAG